MDKNNSIMNEKISFIKQREFGLLSVIIFFSVLLTFFTDKFLTISNIMSLSTGMTYDVFLAIGMTIILLLGGIDLSVGSILGLSGISATMLLQAGVSVPLAVFAGLMTGVFIGFINGLFIAKFKINPFIVTLGMLTVARGLTVVLTSGYFVSNLPQSYLFIGQGKIMGIPIPIYAMVISVLVFDYLLRNWGPLYKSFYIGSNPDAADLSGVNVKMILIGGYIITGFLSGVAGIFMTSRLAMGYAQFGVGAELKAIAASVIGGATMGGGDGSIIGTFLGVLLLAIINNGFVLLNFSIYWQGVVNGSILVIAIVVDAIRRSRNGELSTQ